MPIADWLDMMPATVSVARFQSRDAYGAPTFAAAVNYRARVDFRTRLVRGPNAEMVVARGRAWLATVDAITAEDRVTLPDGSVPIILQVNQVPDEAGPLYTSLDFA